MKSSMFMRRCSLLRTPIIAVAILLVLTNLSGCARVPSPTPPAATVPTNDQSLTEDEIATLTSLVRLDDYPLYSMRYQGEYAFPVISETGQVRNERATLGQSWGCALFAALGDPQQRLYGRNFDWNYSPALLLFTDPPDGYASVSMVDMEYLGFEPQQLTQLSDLTLEERRPLLYAPALPFDGMNEMGVAVGMAAVPPGDMRPNSQKQTVGELGVIRLILDQAASVDEAVKILGSYNIDMGEVPLHYLIASISGDSVLVEFFQGEMHVFQNEVPWQLATNFLVAGTDGQTQGQCLRYDHISQRLEELEGRSTVGEALRILDEVSQGNSGSETSTQWSVVYDMGSGEVHIVMGQEYSSGAQVLKLDGK